MRMNTPRVAPLDEQELTPEMLDLLGPRFSGIPLLNIFRTLARAPNFTAFFIQLFKRWDF